MSQFLRDDHRKINTRSVIAVSAGKLKEALLGSTAFVA